MYALVVWSQKDSSAVAATSVPAGLQHSSKEHDVIGLSNLCVDIVIPVQQLPPPDADARQALLQQLTADPPDEQHWELGGNCNFMIAAARMGMRVGSIGHVGNDMYGRYMDRVLQVIQLASGQGALTAHGTDKACTWCSCGVAAATACSATQGSCAA
jgi:hypothetical protein